ncbi:MAG: GNAT family N-acetyltransferase [Nocardioides sp.]
MDIRQLDRRDVETLHRFWEIGKDAENAFRPYDFYVPWESAVGQYTHPRTGFEDVLIGAFDGEQMLGRAFLRYPLRDNQHAAFAEFHVHPDHQRRGIGRALVQYVEDRVRADGRRVVMAEAYSPMDSDSAGLAFAEAMGFSRAIEDGMKIVDLFDTEHTWAALEAEALPRGADYTFVAWQERVPDEHVAGFCALNEAYNDLAPSGELELEPEVWDEDRVRQGEEQALATGRHVLAVAAIAPDGTMAGLTELVVNEHARHRGFQSGTLVLPEHRGHALGLVMKLANHRAVRAAYPECRVLMTGNAGVNVAMNAVNERLGFREVERCVEVQKDLS